MPTRIIWVLHLAVISWQVAWEPHITFTHLCPLEDTTPCPVWHLLVSPTNPCPCPMSGLIPWVWAMSHRPLDHPKIKTRSPTWIISQEAVLVRRIWPLIFTSKKASLCVACQHRETNNCTPTSYAKYCLPYFALLHTSYFFNYSFVLLIQGIFLLHLKKFSWKHYYVFAKNILTPFFFQTNKLLHEPVKNILKLTNTLAWTHRSLANRTPAMLL